MENKGECYRCRNFIRYYTRGAKQFNQTKFGWCGAKLCTVSNREGCEQYVFKKPTKKSRETLRICLSNLLTEISAIRQVLEDENADKNV